MSDHLPYACIEALQHMVRYGWRYDITTEYDTTINRLLEEAGYAKMERSSGCLGHRATAAGEQFLKDRLN